jgi:hypothetical protein
MDDIREIEKNKKILKQQKIFRRIQYVKKHWNKYLIGIIIILFLIFPSFFGELIGNWINNFLGNIIKNINI